MPSRHNGYPSDQLRHRRVRRPLLFLSLWPGFAGGFLGFLMRVPIVVLGIIWFLIVRTRLFPSRDPGRVTRRQMLIAPVLVCVTYGLLSFCVPRQIAFMASRKKFDNYLVAAPTSAYRGVPLNRRLGMYHVDSYAADPRGGVFFRTGTSADGLGPDTISYGFAFKPNLAGTPFGHSDYLVAWLTGDWCWFQVSDN